MNFFNYSENRYAQSCYSNLSEDVIAKNLAAAQKDKEVMKSLFLKKDKLAPWELIAHMLAFYDFDNDKVYVLELDMLDRKFPKTKTIKTDYIRPNMTIWKEGKRVKLYLQVAPKTKLSSFKVYTAEEVDKMIREETIYPISYTTYGTTVDTGNVWKQQNYDYVAFTLDKCNFNEDDYNELRRRNSEIVDAVLADIDFDQIRQDYETKFLPEYKQYLKELYSAAVRIQQENSQKREEIEREKQELYKDDKRMEELKSKLQDLSKGR